MTSEYKPEPRLHSLPALSLLILTSLGDRYYWYSFTKIQMGKSKLGKFDSLNQIYIAGMWQGLSDSEALLLTSDVHVASLLSLLSRYVWEAEEVLTPL